jgi:hypothetical protein
MALPSTLTKPEPEGLEVTVMYAEVKDRVAVIVPRPFTVAVVLASDGLAIDIDPEAVHDEKE